MKYFKNIILIFLSLYAGNALAQSYTGDTWEQAKKAGEATVSVAYVETPGLVYRNSAGNLTGVCIDIFNDFVKYVAATKKVNLKTKFVGDGSSFSGMYAKVKASQGGVFGLGNVTITPERTKEVSFSPAYITNFAILITHKEVATLAKLEDLPKTFGSLTAYTGKGTLNEKRIQELQKKYFPAMKIEAVATSQDALEKITKDLKGFGYLDLAFYLQAVKDHSSLKRHPVGDQGTEQFGLVMPKGSDWGPLWDEFFKANGGYLNSPAYREIIIKHLGATGAKLLKM